MAGPGRRPGAIRLGRNVMDDAYEALMSLVLDEGLSPGTPLRIDAIAREWGVSQTPLREALAKLENTGLVVRVPNKGYMVAPLLSEDEFHQLMKARLLIEPYNAREACSLDAAGTAEALRQCHARMTAASDQQGEDDFRDYLRADSDFHDVIAKACGNRFLEAVIDPLGAHIQRFRRFHGGRVTDSCVALAEHQAILDAFEGADPGRCENAMRLHLQGVAARAHGTAEGAGA
ncbi:GntR family transcriptional regulator [Peterkaempfera griseoplana]|uniref:GntR family transcriptional regulator n=1 Tax=Peterkaempfera griseoplana TaxID=66896 RepID=UPI0006E3AE64|nr:GntR family transcriptional regulator [Peterkaempfera griseoplana]